MDIVETHDLMGVLRNMPPLLTYWLDLSYKRTHLSNDEWIDFDLVGGNRRLAPFVAPNVQGQPILSEGYSTRRFKTAYLKPKEAFDPSRVLRRQAGEAIGGDLTPQQREDAILADMLAVQREMIIRRWEWMAAQATIYGEVTVTGENYPTRLVAFGRDPSNSIALAGGALWSASTTATPLKDIQAWAAKVQRSGRSANRLTMGIDAANAFFATDEVKEAAETRRGSLTRYESKNVSGDEVVYLGTLEGGIDLYRYNDVYEDNDGVEHPFLEPEDVVLTGDIEGVRAFGAIMDRKNGYRPSQMFPKMWESEDPSGLFVMTQSAPLMIPTRPNASLLATVL